MSHAYFEHPIECPECGYHTHELVEIPMRNDRVLMCEGCHTELLENEEILCEVTVIQQLYPLNVVGIIESVKKTKKIIVIDDSSGSNSLGSEIISQLSQKGLSFKSKIICSKEDIIPSSKLLEKDHYPNNKTMYNDAKNFFLAT